MLDTVPSLEAQSTGVLQSPCLFCPHPLPLRVCNNIAVMTTSVKATSPLLQYAFLVTASVQFAGGIIIFFGLLVSPEEIGEEKPSLLFEICYW